jgi:hypothetical protein
MYHPILGVNNPSSINELLIKPFVAHVHYSMHYSLQTTLHDPN